MENEIPNPCKIDNLDIDYQADYYLSAIIEC